MRSVRAAAGALLREAALGAWLGMWLLGVGGRVAMRLVALTTGQAPAWSVGGTLTIVAAGAGAGVAGVALHAVSRAAARRIAGGRAWVRLGLFAVLLALVTARGLRGSPGPLLPFWLATAAYGVALAHALARRARADSGPIAGAAAGVLAAVVTVALLGCGAQPRADAAGAPGADTSALTASARTFLSTLSDRQRDVASFPFDDPERTKWAYVPQSRRGIPLKAMNAGQRAAAFGILGTGLSERGTRLAHGVIELEGTLGELEGLMSRVVLRRDPELYYLSLFVGPGGTHPWGWRFEGHHLSVNVTELGPHGRIVAPLFMGANPARVPSGPKAGNRLLAAEEDIAFELLHMLDPQQRARATIAAQTAGDIVSGTDPAVRPMAFAGLPAAEMTTDQQRQLRRLLDVYAGRMSDSSAARQWQRIDDAGFGRLHFAWMGAHQPRRPHYYRIHGPTVLVEYDNSQGGANHIHTVWRDLENDFGGDLLRKHYARQPHRD